jgi:hypothetical protein
MTADGGGMTPVHSDLGIDELRDMVQDARLNFLLGAGASMPFIALLGDTENLLTAIDSSATDEAARSMPARASTHPSFARSSPRTWISSRPQARPRP